VRAVLVAAWPRPVPLELLARRSRQPTGLLLAAVTRARVCGVLAEGPDGLRLRRAPTPEVRARLDSTTAGENAGRHGDPSGMPEERG